MKYTKNSNAHERRFARAIGGWRSVSVPQGGQRRLTGGTEDVSWISIETDRMHISGGRKERGAVSPIE